MIDYKETQEATKETPHAAEQATKPTLHDHGIRAYRELYWMLNHISIRLRLFILAGAGIAFTLGAGIIALINGHSQASLLHDTMRSMAAAQQQHRIIMLHQAMRGNLYQAAYGSASGQPATSLQDSIHQQRIALREAQQKLLGLLPPSPQRTQVEANASKLEQQWQLAEQLITQSQNGMLTTTSIPPFQQQVEQLHQDMLQLHASLSKHAEGQQDRHSETTQQVQILITIGMVLATSVLLALSWLILRSIILPLLRIQQFMQSFDGDLSRNLPIHGTDEIQDIARGLNQILTRIRGTVEGINLATSDLIRTAETLADHAMSTNTQARDIAASVQSVSASTEQLSSAIGDIAGTIGQTAHTANRANTIVAQSKDSMSRSMQSTHALLEATQGSATMVNELSHSAEKIGAIAKTIKEIADQTNLLALNAAIEAARAGEQGRGFAVVADEVRKLAERTASSTADIASMIQLITRATGDAIGAMQTVTEQVKSGAVHLEQAHQSQQEIVDATEAMRNIAAHITHTTREQSVAIEDTARNMSRINNLTEANLSNSDTVVSAAEHLNDIAAALQTQVNRFKT